MEIRYFTQSDDRLAICHIYEQSWKYAYKDIIPQSFLDSIPSGRWASNPDKNGMKTLVMTDNGIYIGTTSFCKSRFKDYDSFGEIVSIYFLPEYVGKGYGHKLLEAAVNELSELGFRDIFLWVLEDNHNARHFYEKYGFKPTDIYLDDNIGGKDLREIQYRYHINDDKAKD